MGHRTCNIRGGTMFYEEWINLTLTTVAGSLSIFGTTFIFVTFLLWPDLRTSPRKILVYISIGDFLTALVNISGVWATESKANLGVFCEVQATVNIAAILSSFFWTVYLSVYLYLELCVEIRNQTERRVMMAFHLTAWGIPLLVAVLANVFGAVGVTHERISDGWCWINTANLSWQWLLFWMVFAGKGWEIISYVAISFFYTKVKLFLKKQLYPTAGTPILATQAVVLQADRKFTFIPIIFILLRIWGTVRFLGYAFCLPGCKKDDPFSQSWLKILHGVGDSSQGFANFVIFCIFTEKIRTKLKFWFNKVFPRCVVPRHINHNRTSYDQVVYQSANRCYTRSKVNEH